MSAYHCPSVTAAVDVVVVVVTLTGTVFVPQTNDTGEFVTPEQHIKQLVITRVVVGHHPHPPPCKG